MRAVIALLALLVASPVWGWVYTLDFEGGTVGDNATPYASGGFSEVLVNVKFANDRVHSGSKAAKFTMGPTGCPSDRTAYGMLDHPNLGEGSEIWVRWYQWVDASWTWSGTFNKVMRNATTASDGETNNGMVGIGDGWGSVYYGNEPLDIVPVNFTTMTKGQWQCFETYHKISYTAGNAIARVWRDGVLVYQNTTYPNLRTAGSLFINAQFYGTINCPGLSSSQYLWIDDVIITNERPTARDAAGNYYVGTGSFTPVEDTTAPTITSVTVGTNGTTLAVNMSEAVTGGTTGAGGFTVSPSGGAATVTYASGSGSSTLYYTISRSIAYGETLTASYTKPASAYVEDISSNTNDLLSRNDIPVTNYVPAPGGSAPVMSNLTPSGMVACEAHPQPITYGLLTKDGSGNPLNATCRGTLTNKTFDEQGAGANFDTTGGSTHSSIGLPGVDCGTTFTLYVQCRDGSGNTTVTPGLISASVADTGDFTPPVISSVLPSGSQTYAAGAQTISGVSNENATCRYGTLSLSDYYSYPNIMSGGGTTSHSADLTGLADGTTHTRYGRCVDAAGNVSDLVTWSWSYPTPEGTPTPNIKGLRFSGGVLR